MNINNHKYPEVTVISMCKRDHADVWRLTSEMLLENIAASKFVVYVPAEDLTYFQKITNKNIQVKSQGLLGDRYRNRLFEKMRMAGNQGRYGWYLQQFYKIEALIEATGDVVVIWDADCVPLSNIPVFDSSGLLTFMDCSSECHMPYFENIERLLLMGRIQKNSFVIPGFPFWKDWIYQFIEYIELKNKDHWYEAIMKSTDFSMASGFSETETLGTWMANTHASQWSTYEGRWERRGQSRFGFAGSFTPVELTKLAKKNDLQIISFENWDLWTIKNFLKKLSGILSKLVKKVGL